MCTEVYLAGGGLSEPSVADRTLVRTFPRVYPDMLLEARLLGEVLATRVTTVRSYHLKKGLVRELE